jgi:hypothetical protein
LRNALAGHGEAGAEQEVRRGVIRDKEIWPTIVVEVRDDDVDRASRRCDDIETCGTVPDDRCSHDG